MEITSPKKMETVKDIDYFFSDGSIIQLSLRPGDTATSFSWGTRVVLSDGRTCDVFIANLLYSASRERQAEVVERTPSGMPASVVNFIQKKQ